MDVTLTPDLEDLVREKVETGLYRDESEVIAEALRLLDRFDRGSEAAESTLRAAIQRGLDDYDAGRFTVINNEEELEAFFRDL
jgi:antitoxin ParD1/3/4